MITDESAKADRLGAMLRDFAEPLADDPSTLTEPGEPKTPAGRVLTEWLVVLVGAVVVALVLRVVLFQAFWIPSESMENTLQAEDRVLVNKLSYRFGDIDRGDVVVFRRPDEQPDAIQDLIKRVIGVEGDIVEIRGNQVFVNGEPIEEPYVDDGERMPDFAAIEVPTGHMFVMGDNRDASFDSRFFGPVPTDRIIGRAFVVFWPMDRVGLL